MSVLWLIFVLSVDPKVILGTGLFPVVLIWGIIWVVNGFRKKDVDKEKTASDISQKDGT